MNWVDFNIICVGEKTPEISENEYYSTEVMNRNCNKSQKCYVENWDILNRIQGIWYEFWSKDEKYDFLVNSDWENPERIEDAELSFAHGYRLYVEPDNRDIIGDLIAFYIERSPVGQIIVLFRHQGHESERFHNKMSSEEFLANLVDKKIYGNVAYIVGE